MLLRMTNMTPGKFLAISILLLLVLSSCMPEPAPVPTSTPPPTSTLTSTPTASLTATSTPSITPTPTPSFTASNTPFPAAYLTLNVNQYGSYTVYWKRALWESAVGSGVLTEDFESDTADYGELSFPYLTGHGFLLDCGECSAQILRDETQLPTGNLLHFRSWGSGLRFAFPDNTTVSAFGFDYRPSENWLLIIDQVKISLPAGRAGFVGIVFSGDGPAKFVLTSLVSAQGGLSVDNLSYIKSAGP